MKILVITGSPHRRGTSMLLADEFSAGAEAAGHKVIRFDAASSRIEPCRACDYCRSHDTEFIQKDDMVYLRDDLLEADAIAFVTPLYYFGMSAQLKRVIDRFYALNDALRTPKRALLLATCGDTETWVADALQAHYEALCRYLRWQDCGRIIAIGAYTRSDIETSDYPGRARRLGESLA